MSKGCTRTQTQLRTWTWSPERSWWYIVSLWSRCGTEYSRCLVPVAGHTHHRLGRKRLHSYCALSICLYAYIFQWNSFFSSQAQRAGKWQNLKARKNFTSPNLFFANLSYMYGFFPKFLGPVGHQPRNCTRSIQILEVSNIRLFFPRLVYTSTQVTQNDKKTMMMSRKFESPNQNFYAPRKLCRPRRSQGWKCFPKMFVFLKCPISTTNFNIWSLTHAVPHSKFSPCHLTNQIAGN